MRDLLTKSPHLILWCAGEVCSQWQWWTVSEEEEERQWEISCHTTQFDVDLTSYILSHCRTIDHVKARDVVAQPNYHSRWEWDGWRAAVSHVLMMRINRIHLICLNILATNWVNGTHYTNVITSYHLVQTQLRQICGPTVNIIIQSLSFSLKRI